MTWNRVIPLALLCAPLTALADVAPSGCRCDIAGGSLAPGVVLVALGLVALWRR